MINPTTSPSHGLYPNPASWTERVGAWLAEGILAEAVERHYALLQQLDTNRKASAAQAVALEHARQDIRRLERELAAAHGRLAEYRDQQAERDSKRQLRGDDG